MKLKSKDVLIRHIEEGAPLCGFITYISGTEPTMLRRTGWEIADDIHDDYADCISYDNGRTWSEPRTALSKTPTDGGFLVNTENAVLYLPERDTLIHFTNQKFEADLAGCSLDYPSCSRITIGAPLAVSAGEGVQPLITDFGMRQGVTFSFCNPTIDSRGRILAPVMWPKIDTDGSIRARGYATRSDMPDVMRDVWEVGMLIGEWEGDKVRWHLGNAVPCEFEKSSRGMNEGTHAELADGRLAMILRGSNAGWSDKPGYKWLSFSSDGGETWSEVTPLPCDDGTVFESSATGSALFRDIKDGKLYWIGNLCANGERPHGNMPRSPLFVAEVQEEPFALKKDTLFAVDQCAPHEDAFVQHSNFKFYQDRENGDLNIFLTRYGERGSENNAWKRADLYQYRIEMG